jgi:ABC-type nitrate/sulfonate/bicarbonate transport system substrate-binding protein
MNNKANIVIAALIALSIGGGIWFGMKTSRQKTETVVIRELQTTAPTQWELIKKLTGSDILAEEDIRVETVSSIQNGGTVSLMALMANNIDTGGSMYPAWVNIIARGGKIKALLGTSVSTIENEGNTGGLMVLEESNIHSIRDLPGKRVAVNVLGAEEDYVLQYLMKKNGLSISQVELVVVPPDKQDQMLRSRQVDAALQSTAGIYFHMIVDKGGVRVIPGTSNFEVKGECVRSAIGFRTDFIEKHPEVVRKYIRAYDRSRRIIYDEFNINPERVRKAYADISVEKGSNPKLAKYFYGGSWTPDFPFIVDKDLQWWIDRLVEDGILKPGQIKPSDIYTNEFNPLYRKQ